jgi:nitrogen regulatory protein P-II 1
MKQIIAFVQPFMADKVVDALHAVKGLPGATVTECRGFGRGRARTQGREDLLGTVPRVRIDAMVPDGIVDEVVKTIREAAHTGNRGDGKVYVAPLEDAVRISTGEEGEAPCRPEFAADV